MEMVQLLSMALSIASRDADVFGRAPVSCGAQPGHISGPARTDHDHAQLWSFFFKSSLTTPGFALPPVAFIVWPTKNPNSASLPPR
jgi:hypothetical protein